MNLMKEIDLNKKILVILIMLSVLTIGMYSSYALFEKKETYDNVLKIQTADELPIDGILLLDKIKEKANSGALVEDDDGTIYVSGTKDKINFNYVWYSGKLWRITSINPDNTIKMITNDAYTSINSIDSRSSSVDITDFLKTELYQWLNEDFKDTLYNYQDVVVTDATWYVAMDSNNVPVKPETLENQKTVTATVGLLSAYEYYMTYHGTSSYLNGYLKPEYPFILITPKNSSHFWAVSTNGALNQEKDLPLRPSINLKSNVHVSEVGDGSKNNPYIIIGDKEVATEGDLINTRISGEYVNFDGKKFRIVGVENNITKLVSVDYFRNSNNEVMTKYFPTTKFYGDGDSNNYWDFYLNNDWYENITPKYKNMLIKDTYYIGDYGSYNGHISYKYSICKFGSGNVKTCTKVDKTWYGFVGLLRIGEMFSTQLADQEAGEEVSEMFLITPYSSISDDISVISVNGVEYDESVEEGSVFTDPHAVRPTITLKSDVYISSGSGTKNDPYELSL